MLDDNVVTLVLVGHVQLIQQVVSGLAHLQITGKISRHYLGIWKNVVCVNYGMEKCCL